MIQPFNSVRGQNALLPPSGMENNFHKIPAESIPLSRDISWNITSSSQIELVLLGNAFMVYSRAIPPPRQPLVLGNFLLPRTYFNAEEEQPRSSKHLESLFFLFSVFPTSLLLLYS